MTFFEWQRPDWWQKVAPGTVRDTVALMGQIYSLRATRSEDSLLEFLRRLTISETDVSVRVLGAYPLAPADVKSFLAAADAILQPPAAAARITERLIGLEGTIDETTRARNILDVWQHCHDLIVGDAHRGDHCLCLMHCEHMPRGIRTLDEAVQTYYEQHHELPVPECFGSSDESYRQSLRPLLRRCLDGASEHLPA